jgi:hypothetical protein
LWRQISQAFGHLKIYLFGCDRVGKYVPRDPFDATATMLCTYCMYTCIRTPEKNIFLLVGEEMKKAFLCFEKSANWRRKKLRKKIGFFDVSVNPLLDFAEKGEAD